MIVVVDNYDSFTYNLVQFIGELGALPLVFRNDATTPEAIRELSPRGVIISPGPCTPEDAGISIDVCRVLSGTVPLLGVCLGHQSIGAAFGATISRTTPVHGKASAANHFGGALFDGVASPFRAGRYHSLVVEDLPSELEVTATVDGEAENDIVMGIKHREHDTYGVQFHPESILTQDGKKLLRNFLSLCGEVAEK